MELRREVKLRPAEPTKEVSEFKVDLEHMFLTGHRDPDVTQV
jgi:hypothetical protein